MKKFLLLLGVMLGTMTAVQLRAQPANDTFAGRFLLTGAQTNVTGSNVGATGQNGQNGEPDRIAGQRYGATVWWQWTAPANGTAVIRTTGSSFDTVLGVFTGSPGALTSVAENNNEAEGINTSRVQFNAVAGTAYQILVAGFRFFGNPATGTIQLGIVMPPSVTITAPAGGTVFTAGSNFTLSATATTPSPPVRRVEFYRGGSLIGADTNPPYSMVVSNSPLGTNSLMAVVTDNASVSAPSPVVNVAVLNTGVTIVSPADGAVFGNYNPITVNAVGLAQSGSVTNVQFFVDGQQFGASSTAPFNAVWSAPTPGVHRLLATGRDNMGLAYTSAPVLIAVAHVLVPSNSVWRFNDTGTDLGAGWIAPGYDETSWGTGAAELGYGNGDEATVISFGPDANNKHPTAYFRKSFEVTNAASLSNMVIYVERDDGVVVYCNGREVYRSPNMPAGTINFTTLTTDPNGINDVLDVVTVSSTNLVNGTNVLAAEVHQQSVTSSDISFNLQLVGLPVIIRNQLPLAALTDPTNSMMFFAPSSIALAASASDSDGSVTKVEFFADGAKLGEATDSPYEFTWNNPPIGPHVLAAVATDNEGGRGNSAPVNVTVFDQSGTPWGRITSPTEGQVFDGPTNLLITAEAATVDGTYEVQFYANGASLGTDFTAPFSLVWSNATFGTNFLELLVFDGVGGQGEATRVTFIVNPPPPNLFAPTIAGATPAQGASVGALTSVQVTFSERVIGVNAGDLLLNGVPATTVSGSGSNYTFTVTQPPQGEVTVTWAADHGIEDVGYPPMPFDETAPDASWSYTLTDLTPPTIVARNPAAGSTLTNLSQIAVSFSEPVSGVDASDLLINGSPAFSLAGGGASYTFGFSQPAGGTVTISWAGSHGIADLAPAPNAFNSAGAGWSYTLDLRTILVQSNANWLFIKAFAEASSPIDAWRQSGFDDSSWSNAPAPFFYGDPYGNGLPASTLLSDMQGGAYSSIYLRKTFTAPGASGMTNLFLVHQIDDGFIAWINGTEVARVNMGAGDIPYNGSAPQSVNEPNQNGAAYISLTLQNANTYLVEGTNVLAVHAFNNQPLTSSDFGFNAQLFTFTVDPSQTAPRISSVSPAAGAVFYLTNITVSFNEAVTGVDAGDLLVNNVAATGVTGGTSNRTYTFSFAQPAYGPVAITWATGHGIVDFDPVPKPFDGTASGASFQYTLLNPSTPTVAAQSPLAGVIIPNTFTQLDVTFSESVTGVDASDLRINGLPAGGVSGSGTTYRFTFPQPPYGTVSIAWDASHGIEDLEMPPNAFDPSRPGSTWSYTLIDQTPPIVASRVPAAGALVTNLTQISVTFSEPVNGVNASDLRVNGAPAASVSGTNEGPYTFTFAQANSTLINITWTPAHGITDQASPVANVFNGTGPGATWSYTSPDTLPPGIASIDPPPFVTVRSLTQVRVTFTEPVVGVDTNDLLLNNVNARSVTGSGAGPYTFTYLPPSPGAVSLHWITGHGITDLATPVPNSFPGGEWAYTYDPNATFAGKILISEIMFDPPGGAKSNEWIELRNVATNLINLTGWRFSRGLDYTFPNVSIPAGGYLVVAADLAAFQGRYPAVSNVVGGWSGSLANTDETLELQTALGESVNTVHYASDGDWGQRVRGNGSDRVESIVRNGNTATVTIFQHTYSGNDQVVISGADQPEYNGRFTVTGAGGTTFNITVAGTPASPATGNILCRWVLDDNNAGWSWFNGAGGYGPSLELINPSLPNSAGQNWAASMNAGGTPGKVNSVAANNIPPLISDVTHFPAVPGSSDPVTITARATDELTNGVSSLTLYYREHTAGGPGIFNDVAMFDDGTHGDGVSGDRLFGAVLPPAPHGTVIEFYIQADDTGGRSRTWPAPALDTNGVGATFGAPGQFANALYQVDNEVITNAMGSLRIVLSGTERAAFPPGNRNSDASPNCTLISTDGDGTKIRYLCSVRVRGAGSRQRTPPNNRIDIPNDNRWNGLASINLNSQYVHAQLLGNNLALKSGLPAEPARVVQYRINGGNPARITAPPGGNSGDGWGTFLLVAPPNGDLAGDLYPQDGGGNYYRASTANHNADLSYQNGIPANYLGRGYYKTSNRSENDWSDFAAMTFGFSQVAAEADYLEAIRTNVNLQEWATYFAVGSMMNFSETSLFNGRGDDYALYRGEIDKRFVVLGHDFDTIFGQGDTTGGTTATNFSIFLMIAPFNNNANVPNLNRFIRSASVAPLFYSELKRLCDTTFHPTNLNPFIDQLLGNWNGPGPDANVLNAIKTHAAGRRAHVLSQIPLTLTVASALPTQSGYLFTTTPGATLFGTAHAIDTRKVLVNGVPAAWSAFDARWTNTVALQPGINRVLVQSLDSNDVVFASRTADVWYDDASTTGVSGAIAADTFWTAGAGPYNVTGNITVNSGATLTIQPGTTVYLGAGVNITVANGGRLLAEGTATSPIRFTRAPGAATSWGGVVINGGVGSPQTRIAHAHFEFNGSTAVDVNAGGELFLGNCSFGNTAVRYLDLDGASFVVEDCHFPNATAAFEPIHGSSGIKAGGRGIFQRCFVGRAMGYNDSIDFTGGNRPGPILQILNCVFNGSDDDLLDLDSTDAWIEGNIFLHVHRNGSPDSASAISGGADNADTSQITAIRNLFYNVDQAANAKQGNFYTFINNTVANQNRIGSQDTESGVITMADDGTVPGLGLYLEGNIISGAERLVRTQSIALVTFTNNILHQVGGPAWSGPGGNNSTSDPLLAYVPLLAETTNFTTWASAQVMWDWFSLRPGSPARGTGPNGRDKGAAIPAGASISGEPVGTTPLNSATLRVGPLRTGGGIPSGGFPNGSGFTHYRWRLDGGPWSAERSATNPISLTALGNGPHYVEVSGRNDAGFYQDDAAFGGDGAVTVSRTWIVQTGTSPLRLSEILAVNNGASNHFGTTPDLIELWNSGNTSLDLSGVGITDDPANPAKFLFPLNTTLAAGAYLTVFANNVDGTSGHHLGFGLPQSGGAIYLFDAAGNGGALIDSVSFGLQLPNLSVGRVGDGIWTLCTPTINAPNRGAPTGDPRALRINEWLAIAGVPFGSDFVEVYNTGSAPVALGGLYLSDEILGWPARHQMPALSFIGGNAYLRLQADGDASAGADHLNFNLNGDQGSIGIFLPDLTPIDCVVYQAQLPNVSQGRSPNGSSTIGSLSTPTPGAPNPIIIGPTPNGNALVVNEVLAINSSLTEPDGRTPDWVELYNGTATNVDLGDRSLTDNTLAPRKFVFAPGTSIAPGSYLRVLCDPGATNSGPLVNTNFAVRFTGGAIYLFDAPANGGGLLDSINYGLQIADLAVGRVPDGGTNWALTSPTPGTANTAVPSLASPSALRINEWLAASGAGEDDWFELYNPATQPVALGGLHLSDNLNNPTKHQIAALSFLGGGTNGFLQIRADGNTGAGADHVGFSLNATNEAIGLYTAAGAPIDEVTFMNQLEGVSSGRFPDGSATIVSFPGTASPAAPNYRILTSVVVNEVLTHTDEPLEDAIELLNLTAQAIDVSGWWLSDDPGTLQKYQIPFPTVIPPHGFRVIYETHFTNANEAALPFALSSHGDEIVLSAATNNALTGFRNSRRFGAADNSVSFGRYVTSDGRDEFVAMSARSFGADDPGTVQEFRTGSGTTNAYPKVGPVVISEIMYHPPDDGTNDNSIDEFIELRNITTAPVPLYDPAHPTNVWRLRDAVDFNFATGTMLKPGGMLLVVGFDPVNNLSALAAFRTRYRVDGSTPIVGPWSGKLGNDDEDIELRKPGVPDTNGVDYILVERVHYFDLAPWPALADGTGLSLQRIADNLFGDDPANWTASAPTPGPQSTLSDTDSDGMLDAWEYANGYDPFNAADARLDSDGDGLSTLQEYHLGTDPRNAASGLRLSISLAPGPSVTLSFFAPSNFNFSVEYTDALGAPWQILQEYAVAPTNRAIALTVPATGTARFYRLRAESGFNLRFTAAVPLPGQQMRLGFAAPAHQGRTVLFKAALSDPEWTVLTNFPPVATNRVIQTTLPAPGSSGFFRLRSP